MKAQTQAYFHGLLAGTCWSLVCASFVPSYVLFSFSYVSFTPPLTTTHIHTHASRTMHRGNNWKRDSDKQQYNNRPICMNEERKKHARTHTSNQRNKNKVKAMLALTIGRNADCKLNVICLLSVGFSIYGQTHYTFRLTLFCRPFEWEI